jgi:hypothetical protein
MEILKYINENQYKNHTYLIPTFETYFMNYRRNKAPLFPMGSVGPDFFKERQPNVTINVLDDDFMNIKDGQDIRVIFKGYGSEECYLMRNVRKITKNNRYICQYSLIANVIKILDYKIEEGMLDGIII